MKQLQKILELIVGEIDSYQAHIKRCESMYSPDSPLVMVWLSHEQATPSYSVK